jgi:hypothetical protein
MFTLARLNLVADLNLWLHAGMHLACELGFQNIIKFDFSWPLFTINIIIHSICLCLNQ